MANTPEVETIERFVVPWTELDWPLDWEALFGRPGTLELEIGFGNGAFLIDQAMDDPSTRFVGIELGWGSVQRLLRKTETAGLTNIRVIQSDAAFAVAHLFHAQSLQRVFINFSDPWPKERHHNRRLIQPGFLRVLADRMAPHGELVVATDHGGYAEWIGEVIGQQDRLQPETDTLSVEAIPGRKPTKYEARAIRAGSPIHYFLLRRGEFAAPETPEQKVEPMPNVILRGPFDPESFCEIDRPAWQFERSGEPVVVKVRGVYQELGEGHHLVEVMVKEGAFTQTFGICALVRPPDSLLIKLSPLGHPRPTWGVKQAVRLVAETICSGNSDLRVESSTVGHPPAATGIANVARPTLRSRPP